MSKKSVGAPGSKLARSVAVHIQIILMVGADLLQRAAVPHVKLCTSPHLALAILTVSLAAGVARPWCCLLHGAEPCPEEAVASMLLDPGRSRFVVVCFVSSPQQASCELINPATCRQAVLLLLGCVGHGCAQLTAAGIFPKG